MRKLKLSYSRADLLLLTTTMIWGWSFIIVKWAVDRIDPYFFIFSRFLLAAAFLLPLFWRRIRTSWRVCLKPGIILGVVLGFAFFTQTIGLKYTSATASGFITGLSVVLVAVMAAVLRRSMPERTVFWGVVAATAGLFLITYQGTPEFRYGDLLTLACAVLFALHVVLTERFASRGPAGTLTVIQLLTVSLMAGAAYLIFSPGSTAPRHFIPLEWLSILYSGFLGTATAFLFQTKAQQTLPPFRTAVLLATEPLFAGIFAVATGFDPFEWRIAAGGLLILCGMILAGRDVK